MIKFLIVLMTLFFSSCAFLRTDNCVKQIGDTYNVFGISFKKQSENFSLFPGGIRCNASDGYQAFTSAFKVIDLGNRYEDGNSAVFNLSLMPINLNIEQKDVEVLIDYALQKREMEVIQIKNSKNSRFLNPSYEKSKLTKNSGVFCKNFYGVVYDKGASNLPEKYKYLVMKNFSRTCYLSDKKIIVDVVLSLRMTPERDDLVNKKLMSEQLDNLLPNFWVSNNSAATLQKILK